jgi:aryl-alcohol dehydrogenase-like predicted oxidoreductase
MLPNIKLNQSNESNRLVIGTAQFGTDYGIANITGLPVCNTVESIVIEAWEFGICEFDTAQAYGLSEQILGKVFKKLGIANDARVITKLAPDVDHADGAALNKALEISLNRLDIDSLYCLMLHREDMLDQWENGLGENLMNFVDSGKVRYIGVSVYSLEKAVQALNTDGISIVQLPSNVIDRRFEKAGIFQIADNEGKTIYIRSIFLQGLLFMSPDGLPEHMSFVAPVLNRLVLFAKDVGLSINELCVGYIKNAFPHARVIFGAETQIQVRENLKCWNVIWPTEMNQMIQTEFKDVDQMVLNPTLWPKRNNTTTS